MVKIKKVMVELLSKSMRQLNKRFVAKPESWDDLFKKYPVGHGLVKEKALNLIQRLVYMIVS